MSTRCPASSPARWPAGGWFGCQVGGTVWLLTGAAGMAGDALPVAGVWAAAFLAANLIGTWLWRRANRPSSAPLMLLGCGAAGLAALVTLDARPLNTNGVPAAAYLIVAGVPAALAGWSLVWGVAGTTGSGPGEGASSGE